jgi:protein-disulfide isomerase
MRHLAFLILASTTSIACGAAAPELPPAAPVKAAVEAPHPPLPPAAPVALTVTEADPARGDASAPVTLVWFGNFDCPFTRKAAPVIEALERAYGPTKMRVVWKSLPGTGDFIPSARRKAETSVAVLQRRGAEGFWAYHRAALGQGAPGESDAPALAAAGVRRDEVDEAVASGAPAGKVDSDVALARKLAVSSTPAFLVNGVFISGFHGIDHFQEIIDKQLAQADLLRGLGVPPAEISVRLTSFGLGLERSGRGALPSEGLRWRVPIGASAARGPASAAVTIVAFGSFDTTTWRRTLDRLEQIRLVSPERLRLVWKHGQSDWAPHAERTSELLHEVRARKGDAAYWRAFDMLVAGAGRTGDDLELIAAAVGLDPKQTRAALDARAHRALVAADIDLGEEVFGGSHGFVINGRLLTGVAPEKLFDIINDELRRPDAGGPDPYAALQQSATPLRALPHAEVPTPDAGVPVLGPANAPVTITLFGDLDDVESRSMIHRLRSRILPEFEGKVRLVYYPVVDAPEKSRLGNLALAALRLKDAAAFFKLAYAIAAVPPPADDKTVLAAHAKAVGLTPEALTGWKDASDPLYAAAKRARAAAEVTAPAFLVEGTLLKGYVEEDRFRRVIRRALARP